MAATLALLALSALAPAAARADEPIDTVFLAKGGRLRGTVIEDVPKVGVTIRLLDGTTRKLPASAVARVEYGNEATAAPAPAAAPAAAPPTATVVVPLASYPAGSPGAMVRLDSDNPSITLQRAPDWMPVCEGSCAGPIDPYATYRIGGPGVRSSRPFTIGAPGPVTLTVKTGSNGAHVAGVVLYFTGMVVAIVGLGALAVMTVMSQSEKLDDGAMPSAAGTALGGIAVAVPGLILMLTTKTHVTTDAGQKLASSPWVNGAIFSF